MRKAFQGRRGGTEASALGLAQEHVKREKRLMAACDCPFMVNLVTSFQDDTCLYLLLESVMGGEFFTWLQVCMICCSRVAWSHVAALLQAPCAASRLSQVSEHSPI